MDTKSKVVKLRRQGHSFRTISTLTKTPLSTVFLWSKEVELSLVQKEKLKEKSLQILQKSRQKAQLIRKKNYLRLCKISHQQGQKIIGAKLTARDLNCICISLYWAEGFKKDNRLGFANSDPQMIRFFIFWLVNYLKAPKNSLRLRVGLNINLKSKIKKAEQYWSVQTGIPLSQFQKPYFQKTKTKKKYSNENQYFGVLRVRANNQNKNFRKILGSIAQLQNLSNNLIS